MCIERSTDRAKLVAVAQWLDYWYPLYPHCLHVLVRLILGYAQVLIIRPVCYSYAKTTFSQAIPRNKSKVQHIV